MQSNDKIKILISTDSAILHSGLAETVRHIFIPLLKVFPNKYHIEQIGFFHHNPSAPTPWPIYQTKTKPGPQGPELDLEDKYGEQSFDAVCSKVKPDIVFGYGDMWHFNHILNSTLRNSFRLCTYYTIDGAPYFGHLEADGTTAWGKNLAKSDQIVVLSHFGKEVLKQNPELKDKDIKVRYHPLEMGRYPLRSEEQKKEIRDKILPGNMPRDAFIMGWCGRNQFRKQNYTLWETLHYLVHGDYIKCNTCERITLKEWNHTARRTKDPYKYKGQLDKLTYYNKGYNYEYCWHCKSENISSGIPRDDIYLWFHMSKDDPGYNPDLHERMWNVGERCIYTSNINNINGVTKEDLAALISVWDCMLYPSGGEGFGNPAWEAMAAGTPVVYSDYSSHAEFCQHGGLPIRVSYIPELHHGIMRSKIDIAHGVEQCLSLYDDRSLLSKLGNLGRMFAAQYDLKHLVGAWDSIFTDMMKKPLPVQGDVLYGAMV